MDITYIPMARGFVYLAAVLDWYSRRVLSWRLSITMEAHFCVEAVHEAAALWQAGDLQHRSGQPVHQPASFTDCSRANDIRISMDGKGLLARQRLRRAAVAQRQVRGGVPQGLRQRQRGARRDRALSRFLQWPPAAFVS